MNFFDRLSMGWTIAMNSFKVLRANKQLLLFPVLSMISMVLVFASFFAFVFGTFGVELESLNISEAGVIALTVLFYIVNYFVIIFFNMALIHCTRLYFHGEEVTIAKGLRFSLSRIGHILAWSVIAGVVGAALRIVQEELGLIGKIITGLIGVVWSIATFFVVPILAYEKVGPFEAIRRSSQMMREKWGESLGARFSIALIQFLACIVVVIISVILVNMVNPIVGIAFGAIAIFTILIVMSAAQTVFISAVYHDVNGDPVEHFQREMIDRLFVSK